MTEVAMLNDSADEGSPGTGVLALTSTANNELAVEVHDETGSLPTLPPNNGK